jgi:hypothetical protein
MRRPLAPLPGRPNPTEPGDAADLSIRRVIREIARCLAIRLALLQSFYLALSPWLKASGTAAEINRQAFAKMWKLPSTTKIMLTA